MGSDKTAPHRSFCPIPNHTEPESIDIPYHINRISASQMFVPVPNLNPDSLTGNDASESMGRDSLRHVLPEDQDLNFAQFDNVEF